MRAVVFAYHALGCLGLREVVAHGFDVVGVFTHPDPPAGSGEVVWWPSVAEEARRLGIPVHQETEAGDPALAARVEALAPDIAFSFYYRHMLSAAVLGVPGRGGLNLHGSLLPRGRGRAPVNWSLVEGDRTTGVSLHYMVEKADAGDLVDQEAVAIEPWDTAYTLYRKLQGAAEILLRRALPALLAGTAEARPMDLAAGCYWGRRTPADGAISWSWPASRIYDLIRAVTHPYPGAFCRLGDRKLVVWWGVPADEEAEGEPGSILRVDPYGVDVGTGSGVLRIQTVQLDGCPEQPATAFVHDLELGVGDRLADGVGVSTMKRGSK